VVDVAALQRENAELRGQVSQLVHQLAKLNERVAELLAIAQRKQRKTPAVKPPAPSPTVEGDAKLAFDERPQAPEKPDEEEKAKSPVKPTGRKKVPPHLEAEEHALRPDACAHCGSAALDAADEIIEEKLHVVKEHQRRRVVRRTTCRCRSCGGRTTPRSLPAPYDRSKVTCEWLAWLVHQKFGLLTPLDRLRRDLAERGVPLAMGTLVSFIERAADLLASVDGYHWRQLLAGSWMGKRCMNPLSSGAEGRLTLGSCFRRPARRAQARSSAGDSSPGRRRAVGSGTVIQPASAASSAASSRARVWFQKSGASSR
jgi:hypothetical protein